MQYFQIEYFLGIVRNGTMNAAAQALNVSQSTLSAALKNLEKELGSPLFDRIGKKLVLNDDGSYFLQQAENIEGLFNETIDTFKSRNDKRSSTVNCALYTPIGNPGTLVEGFKKHYPQHKLRIGFPSAGVFSVFKESDIDINMLALPLHLKDDNAVLLGTEEYAMALPAAHPLAHKKDLALADFANENFVVSVGAKANSCFNPTALCEEAGFSPHIVCEVQWQTEAMQLVEAGVGCCIVPEYTWLAHQSYHLEVRYLHDVKHHRHIYAQLSAHKQPTEAALAFMDYLKDYAKTVISPAW